MMTPGQGLLFVVLVAMVLLWFVCVHKLAQHMRERYPATYEQMRLAGLWPRNLAGWFAGHDNARPVLNLLRFLLRREYLEFRDAELASLGGFMRALLFTYIVLFAALLVWTTAGTGRESAQSSSPERSASDQKRREPAFELHRAGKLNEAIAVYDELLRESSRDAELYYWRAMAHWTQQSSDLALNDFRRVIELQPGRFEAHLYADRILSQQQRWDEILELWNRYLDLVPDNAEGYFERGGTNYRKGDLAAAQADAAKSCNLGKQEACIWAKRLEGRF